MELKPGYKQTEVGTLPEEWAVDYLDGVAKRGSGHTPDKKHPEYWNGSIKWVSLRDSDQLDQIYIGDTAATITEAGVANSSAVVHPAGTVVLSRDAGVGKSAIMQEPMAVSQHFMAWQCTEKLDKHYLYYWLQDKKSEFERIANGSTIKTIGLHYFEELKLPVPHVSEQRAIATALSDVDALLQRLEQLIAKKRDIKQATMQQLLTGKQRLPGFSGEWEVKRLGDLGSFLKGCGVRKDESLSGQLPCIRYGEIYTRHNDYIKEFYSWISPEVAKSAMPLKKGDVLFAGSGETKEEIGKCVAFVDDLEAYAGGDIVILRPANSNAIFLGYFLNTAPVNSQKVSRGQGDAVVHVSASALSSMEVKIPKLEEQTAIATVLSDMDAEITAQEQKRDKTRELKQGMMQQLLTGQIRLV